MPPPQTQVSCLQWTFEIVIRKKWNYKCQPCLQNTRMHAWELWKEETVSTIQPQLKGKKLFCRGQNKILIFLCTPSQDDKVYWDTRSPCKNKLTINYSSQQVDNTNIFSTKYSRHNNVYNYHESIIIICQICSNITKKKHRTPSNNLRMKSRMTLSVKTYYTIWKHLFHNLNPINDYLLHNSRKVKLLPNI